MVRSAKPLFVKDALLVSLAPAGVVEGHLRVEGGRIVEAGPRVHPRGGEEVLDRWGKPVLPGLVVAHHHTLRALSRTSFFRPRAPDPGRSRVADAPRLSSEERHAAACLALLEAVACGATAVFDSGIGIAESEGSLDSIALAYREAGVRGVFSVDVGEEGGEAASAEVRRFLSETPDRTLRLALALDGDRPWTPESERRVSALRQETRLPLHLHLSTDESRGGPGPSLGALRGLLGETSLVSICGGGGGAKGFEARFGEETRIAVCPRLEMAQGAPRTPLERLGERAVLGTGGIDGDLFEETRVAALRARLEGAPFDPLAPLAGAYALLRERFDVPFGAIVPGAAADLVFLDYTPAAPIRTETIGDHLLAISSRHVEGVLVEGRCVYRRREPTFPFDPEAVLDTARAAARKVLESAAA